VQFGRVEVHLHRTNEHLRHDLRLTVVFETAQAMSVVRDATVETIQHPSGVIDLPWLADQLTQETIAVDLALDGWEVIGSGEISVPESVGIARSATYTVRRPST
jgi:hypothetical protein